LFLKKYAIVERMNRETLPEDAISFSTIDTASLECCLEHGAAKIHNVISQESLVRLRNEGVPRAISLLETRVPEIMGFFALLGVVNVDDTKLVHVDVIDPYPNAQGMNDPHIDSVANKGLTLLVPYMGESALFSCDNKPFLSVEQPTIQTEYGPGDAILLRQTIRSVNEDPYVRLQAWHMGISSSERSIITIDYLNEHITTSHYLSVNNK
jgi:hypothetical protein